MYKNLNELEAVCAKCENCSLCTHASNRVFGVGLPDAKVMFVGEAPGETEDQQGVPFVGKAGQLLDLYLNGIGLDRNENVYIANILKCRPPANRDPEPEEQDACIGWLREQVRLIRPAVIVCLGRIAACRLIKPDFRVTAEHGDFFEKNGTLMMGTYHPSALLRDESKKKDALADFLRLRQMLLSMDLIGGYK